MSLHKTDCIVLRSARSGESSLLVYCYLKDGGRTNLLAKGVRNPKSKMVGRVSQFSVVEILYYRSDPEKLGVVSQIDTIRDFPAIKDDIRRLSYASAVVEVLESLVPRDETSVEIFSLMRRTLYQLNYAHGSKLDFLFMAYLLRLLSLSGYHPEFNMCVRTGKDLRSESTAYFSPEEGGVVAKDAADARGLFFKIDQGTRKVLNLILESPIDKLTNVNFSKSQKEPVRAMLLKFLSVQTEKAPNLSSLEFLNKISPTG